MTKIETHGQKSMRKNKRNPRRADEIRFLEQLVCAPPLPRDNVVNFSQNNKEIRGDQLLIPISY